MEGLIRDGISPKAVNSHRVSDDFLLTEGGQKIPPALVARVPL